MARPASITSVLGLTFLKIIDLPRRKSRHAFEGFKTSNAHAPFAAAQFCRECLLTSLRVYRGMSPEAVSHRWLSLRCWLVCTVFPAAASLIAVLAVLHAIGPSETTLDHTAVMVGFAALYFCVFRGGHMLMIRSLNVEMMKKHPDAYREKLARMTAKQLRRSNLGFTLARVKRDILVEARENEKQKRDRLFNDKE